MIEPTGNVAPSRRKKHVVTYHGERLELFECVNLGVSADRDWSAFSGSFLCETRNHRFFTLHMEQRLFSPVVRRKAARLPRRLIAAWSERYPALRKAVQP